MFLRARIGDSRQRTSTRERRLAAGGSNKCQPARSGVWRYWLSPGTQSGYSSMSAAVSRGGPTMTSLPAAFGVATPFLADAANSSYHGGVSLLWGWLPLTIQVVAAVT